MEIKTPRKRVANFTAEEKSLLAQLIKKTPIIESKLTDGKTVLKKKSAWASITAEFNDHANVLKRDTKTLKRAWDNMKALTRKVQATNNLGSTGGKPSDSPEAIVCMVDQFQDGPDNIPEIKNDFDSDGALLNYVYVTSPLVEGNNSVDMDSSAVGRQIDTDSTVDNKQWNSQPNVSDDDSSAGSYAHQKDNKDTDTENQKGKKIFNYNMQKPLNLIRREAMLRIKYLEAQKEIEIQTLKTKLETEKIKQQTAVYYLEKAKLELEEVKNRKGISEL